MTVSLHFAGIGSISSNISYQDANGAVWRMAKAIELYRDDDGGMWRAITLGEITELPRDTVITVNGGEPQPLSWYDGHIVRHTSSDGTDTTLPLINMMMKLSPVYMKLKDDS